MSVAVPIRASLAGVTEPGIVVESPQSREMLVVGTSAPPDAVKSKVTPQIPTPDGSIAPSGKLVPVTTKLVGVSMAQVSGVIEAMAGTGQPARDNRFGRDKMERKSAEIAWRDRGMALQLPLICPRACAWVRILSVG